MALQRFTPDRVSKMYDNWSLRYDQEFMEDKQYRAPTFLVSQFSETKNLGQHGLRVLDVGIGTGWLSKCFKELNPNCHVTGVDISAGMLEKCAIAGVADELIERDFQEDGLPFEDGSFDIVVSSGVFELLDHPDKVLREMGRVLKNGGGLSFTSYSDSSDGYSCLHHDDDVLRRALADAAVTLNERTRFHAFNHGIFNHSEIYYHLYSGVKEEAPFVIPE